MLSTLSSDSLALCARKNVSVHQLGHTHTVGTNSEPDSIVIMFGVGPSDASHHVHAMTAPSSPTGHDVSFQQHLSCVFCNSAIKLCHLQVVNQVDLRRFFREFKEFWLCTTLFLVLVSRRSRLGVLMMFSSKEMIQHMVLMFVSYI